MKSIALSELAIEKERGINGARCFFATRDGLRVFQSYIGAELIVPTFAIREEGASYHHLPPSVIAKPSLDLLKSIKELLSKSRYSI
jgi:uridine phosphorylase